MSNDLATLSSNANNLNGLNSISPSISNSQNSLSHSNSYNLTNINNSTTMASPNTPRIMTTSITANVSHARSPSNSTKSQNSNISLNLNNNHINYNLKVYEYCKEHFKKSTEEFETRRISLLKDRNLPASFFNKPEILNPKIYNIDEKRTYKPRKITSKSLQHSHTSHMRSQSFEGYDKTNLTPEKSNIGLK